MTFDNFVTELQKPLLDKKLYLEDEKPLKHYQLGTKNDDTVFLMDLGKRSLLCQ